MESPQILRADLDEMVFEDKNHEYGAYELRKKYNNRLGRAALIGIMVFVMATLGPWFVKVFGIAGEHDLILDGPSVVVDLVDLPPPPDLEDDVPPPPVIDVPPPRIRTIEFVVPTPVPDETIENDVTIHEMDSIEVETNIGLEDIKGEDIGYDFGEIEGTGEVVAEIEEPSEPDPNPNAFIMVEKEPVPVNMDQIRKNIGYPPTAKEAEIEGKVIVRILVDKEGRYKRHIVVRNPHGILTSAVENQINQLEFTPGIQAGSPIKVWVTIPFDFQLLR